MTFRPDQTVVYLGLGSNQGDRLDHLRRAVRELSAHSGIEVVELSSVYETEYVGEGTQDPYLNACCRIRTNLEPEGLLDVLKSLEALHGRRPDGHMLARPLDLDILLYGNEIRFERDLSLPHPRLRDRAFVLEPLTEIAEKEKFPDSGETVGSACAKIRQKSGPWLRVCREKILLAEGTAASKED
jgi:2-amino-4-hydroxy-6-hydroxymethyldihydropteridine diphosphokinase